jgi:hydroxymethylpyrimidine/phosphomethylpyrimidine kinase
MNPKSVMTIGGSDSSAGAGIQADLKAFTSLNLHGTTVITSITVQNTQTVKKIIPTNPEDVLSQIEAVMEDIPVRYVKTGLLYRPAIAKIVASATKKYEWKLIVDPVLTATSGDSLATDEFHKEIIKTLFPVLYLITPNIPEAEALTQTTITSTNDMKQAAKTLHKMGAKNIVIKGGHLANHEAYDVLYNGTKFFEQSLPRLPHKKAHGSGCTFSALLTGYLAKGKSLENAFINAKYVLWNMINSGYNIGKGSDVLKITEKSIDDAPSELPTPAHVDTWMNLSNILKKIVENVPLSFIPEVGCNIGYALPNATKREEICSINGRITRSLTKPLLCGSLRFGASKHVSSIILATMKMYTSSRCVMNIKYTPENLLKCKKTNYVIASFDRTEEPETVTSTMDWGTTTALKQHKNCPDFIYDKGGMGKEPMIRIIGKNPEDVYTKLTSISSTKK